MRDSLQRPAGAAVRRGKTGDLVNGVEDGMVHGNRLQPLFGEDAGHFAAECAVPLRRRTAGRRQEQAAPFHVAAQVLPFLVGQLEVALAGHDDQGEFEDILAAEFHGMETAARRHRTFFFGGNQEMVRKTTAAFRSRVHQVGHLHDTVRLSARLARIGHDRFGRRRQHAGVGHQPADKTSP